MSRPFTPRVDRASGAQRPTFCHPRVDDVTALGLPPVGPTVPRRGNTLTRWLGRAVLRLLGWRVEGSFPDVPKLVLIAAPHSSNWDFVIGIAVVLALRLRIQFIGKAELFTGLKGWLLRVLGGIPVDRDRPENIVDRIAAEVRRSPNMLLGLAPEGTRRHGAAWKTGFHRIAAAAGTPILPVYFDWSRRVLGLLPPVTPSSDMDADIALLRSQYARFTRRDGKTIG